MGKTVYDVPRMVVFVICLKEDPDAYDPFNFPSLSLSTSLSQAQFRSRSEKVRNA